jgi:hypothetical protein
VAVGSVPSVPSVASGSGAGRCTNSAGSLGTCDSRLGMATGASSSGWSTDSTGHRLHGFHRFPALEGSDLLSRPGAPAAVSRVLGTPGPDPVRSDESLAPDGAVERGNRCRFPRPGRGAGHSPGRPPRAALRVPPANVPDSRHLAICPRRPGGGSAGPVQPGRRGPVDASVNGSSLDPGGGVEDRLETE